MSRGLFIARSEEDIAQAKKSNRRILAINPALEEQLKGMDVVTTSEVYSNLSHARSIVMIRDALEEFEKLCSFSECQVEAAKSTLFYMLGTSAFYYQVLKKYNSLDQLDQLLRQVFSSGFYTKSSRPSFLTKIVMKRHNARIVKEGKKLLIIGGGGRAILRKYADEVEKNVDGVTVYIARTQVKSFLSTLKLTRKKDSLIYFFYPSQSRNYNFDIEKITASAKSEVLKAALSAGKNVISNILSTAEGYEKINSVHLKDLKPNVVCSDSVADSFTTSLRKFAMEQGIKTIVFNHASNTPQTSAISREIANMLASNGMVFSKYSSFTAARSPAISELVKELGGAEAKFVPLRPNISPKKTNNKKFKILYAGNYLEVDNHIPWIHETPDEFLKSVSELAAAVSKSPDTELTIRIQPRKKDITNELLKKRIPAYPNVTINNDRSFAEVLAEADLVVANISATIDEALNLGKPVLLYTVNGRYIHYPAVEGLVHTKLDLDQIRAALPSEVQNPYIWPSSAPDMAELAKKFDS